MKEEGRKGRAKIRCDWRAFSATNHHVRNPVAQQKKKANKQNTNDKARCTSRQDDEEVSIQRNIIKNYNSRCAGKVQTRYIVVYEGKIQSSEGQVYPVLMLWFNLSV